MIRRIDKSVLLIVLAALLAAACGMQRVGTSPPAATSGMPEAAYAPVATGQRLGGGPVVSLLARGFLASRDDEPDGYKAYAYLLFRRPDMQTAERRLLAARAYLRLYRDVSEIVRPPRDMAVFLAPVREPPRWPVDASFDQRVAALLDGYDYDRATVIANWVERSGRAVPDVAIVASAEPIRGQRMSGGEAIIVDLRADTPDGMEACFRSFDEKVYGSAEVRSHDVVGRVREGLLAVGGVVLWIPSLLK